MPRTSIKPVLGPKITEEDRFHANGVFIEKHITTPSWDMWHLQVHSGVLHSLGAEPTPAQKRLMDLTLRYVSIYGTTLSVFCGGILLYTLDVSSLISDLPQTRTILVRQGKNSRDIILTALVNGSDGPLPRSLSNVDLNPQKKAACGTEYRSYFPRDTGFCGRPQGHSGRHQFFTHEGYGEMSSGGGAFRQEDLVGLPVYCSMCNFMSAGDGETSDICSQCDFWVSHSQARHRNAFIIEGRHYMPGKGGFGGHIWKVLRNDGTRWTGELFTQGEIPPHLYDLLPNNAVFED